MTTAEAKWEATVASLREGTRLYLTNDFTGAEKLFREGMGVDGDKPAPAVSIGDDDSNDDEPAGTVEDDSLEARDVRGAFALQYAIVGLMKGVASLANDQLDECLARLWEADALATLDTNWVGKKVVRGVCTLCAGVVQCLQQNIVRGVYNILRSWSVGIRYLRSEALEYRGVGSSVVRSAAQLALGVFAIILSMLPPTMVRAASWSTGFEIDREAGLAMLRTCQEEGGIYAPIAALALLSIELDTKTFLGESQTAADLAYCEGILDWAAERFEDSVFFSLLRAELHACRHELPRAHDVVAGISQLPCVHELRALNAVVAYKRAVYHLAALQWLEAGAAFEESLNVYRAAGRRSMGPAMAVGALLALLLGGDAAKAEEMASVVDEYQALAKSNWARQDRGAFRLLAMYRAQPEAERTTWALLELSQIMTIAMRCTWWQSDEQCAKFVALLEDAALRTPDTRAQRCMILAQVYTHRSKPAEGLAKCAAGLALKDDLGEASREWGMVPMLHTLAAQQHAKLGDPHKAEMALQAAASSAGTSKYLMQHHVTFKTTRLRRSLGLMVQEAYHRLTIGAGCRAIVTARLPGNAGVAAAWDWAPDARDLDFSVTFKADSAQNALIVTPMARHDAASGPVEGRFEMPGGCEGGTLTLEFSNYFSYLRSKSLSYRLTLPDGADEPTVIMS